MAGFIHFCVGCKLHAPVCPWKTCMFIFGDAFSENGNNNNRNTTAKGNYTPYGIEYKQGNNPTGRFTNDRTEADFVAERQGLPDIPPYANIGVSDILKGVNYASAAAGIRPETGSQRGDIISLERQIQNHRNIYNRVVKKLGGSNKAKKYLSKCLYYMKIGTNDYYDNYFFPQVSSTVPDLTTDRYAADLVRRYSSYMKRLHDEHGAKKFLVINVGRIGCSPYSRARSATARGGGCAEEVNDATLLFDRELKSEMERLNRNKLYAKANFMFVNTTTNIDTDPTSLGFTVADTPCCPTVQNATCIPNGTPCSNRHEYAFYDSLNPTSSLNNITAAIADNAIMMGLFP
ncbi:GDSL esterase/lipase At5g45670-like [Vigna unguiculata]|uniref:Zeta-carotene desaturase n=1 Tax=Vigna unguiculata TaxID=3917 RepID=A0A4D6KJU6_VIGUN|nr:GDSL esterase/lipase At5g45670-like [Vigna unguiculata]QCD76925.1 zeta-carotene desaturase [Vigna unguiculata]